MNLLDIFESVNEGWSDAIVSQRTGKPRTPYSVYIKGKEWKSFADDDHAENVANKLRAKFKQEGKDPSVITIAPTGYDKGMKEATPRHFGPKGAGTELARQIRANGDLEKFQKERNTPIKTSAEYINRQANAKPGNPVPPPFGTKVQVKKNKGVAEGEDDDVEHLANAFADIYYGGAGMGMISATEKIKLARNIVQAVEDGRLSIEELKQDLHDVDQLQKKLGRDGRFDEEQGVAEGHADQQRRVFKKNGEPVGEVGIDRESSPGVGQWYMKHYASGKDNVGYDSYEEALAELKHCMKQGVAEAQTDYQKRRQRERDIDAGKPVSRQPKNPQTDYAKKRAQDKRDMELGEGEREPYQQAIDQLTARRIDDLNMKLDDLVQRAKAEKNPEVKAALAKEFRKHKAERDSYFGIDPATGMNASGTLGTVKGALDEVGTVTHTATGLKHQARPDTYGGYEEEPDHLARLDKHAVNRADKALGVKFDREKKYQGGLDIDENNSASAPIKHRVAVTVSDPKHPDMDVMQRTCRVTGPDREKAINSAIAHYRREGFKVHDHHYIGVVDEGSMARAADNSKGPKFRGYWKGTNPNPPKPGQGFGGCEEAENPMGQKELDYLIAKAKGTKSKPDPDLHKGDEHEIGYGQELAEKGVDESMGPLGKITKHMAKSTWATSPSTKYELRKRRNPEQMAKRNGIASIAEAKGLSKQVKIVQGPDAGKIGRIREIKLGAYKGAPKTYYIDLEDGGQANNLPGTALRLVKSEMDEGWKSKLAGAALAGAATLGAGGAHAGGVSTTGQGFSMDDQLALNQQMQQRVQQQYDQAQQQKPQAPTSGFSKEYLQKVVSGEHPRPMLSKEKAQELLSQMNESNINESLKRGEYYVWTVYFDDGTSKRIKVPSDEFDPYEYYKKQNKVVVNVDYSWDIQGQ